MANQDDFREEQTLKAFETVGKVLFAALGAWALSLLIGHRSGSKTDSSPDGPWLTTKEACAFLKVSKSTFWKLSQTEKFDRRDVGGRPKYSLKKLELYLKRLKE